VSFLVSPHPAVYVARIVLLGGFERLTNVLPCFRILGVPFQRGAPREYGQRQVINRCLKCGSAVDGCGTVAAFPSVVGEPQHKKRPEERLM
jgi:hypothetical protein